MIPFGTQAITVRRPTTVTDHGSQLIVWTNPTEHVVTGCSVQPAGGVEDEGNRDAITTRWTVFAPPTADVADTDRIVFDGTPYDIDGPVRRWPGGILDHLEITLRKVQG